MARVIALQAFDHGGPRVRGAEFDVSEGMAAKLRAKGLVRVQGDGSDKLDPSGAAGEPSSASQVAPASPQATVSSSGSGGRKRKAIALEPMPQQDQEQPQGAQQDTDLESEQPQAETGQEEVQSGLL